MWLTANTNLYIQPKIEQKCQAHNLKVVGSNPTPATNLFFKINDLHVPQELWFLGLFVVILSVYTNHYTNRSSGFSNLIITIRIFNYSFRCTL